MSNPITIQTTVNAPIETVWQCWNSVDHIGGWAFATDDWEATPVHNDLEIGGTFKTVMGAKDKSFAFDFAGTYSNIVDHQVVEYDLEDGRHVSTTFTESDHGVEVVQVFDPESENSIETQREGWQGFLNNFQKYTESQVA